MCVTLSVVGIDWFQSILRVKQYETIIISSLNITVPPPAAAAHTAKSETPPHTPTAETRSRVGSYLHPCFPRSTQILYHHPIMFPVRSVQVKRGGVIPRVYTVLSGIVIHAVRVVPRWYCSVLSVRGSG